MHWIIIGFGVVIFFIGVIQSGSMHDSLSNRGHHWEPALDIGQKAGLILGFGFGILFAALMYIVLGQVL